MKGHRQAQAAPRPSSREADARADPGHAREHRSGLHVWTAEEGVALPQGFQRSKLS